MNRSLLARQCLSKPYKRFPFTRLPLLRPSFYSNRMMGVPLATRQISSSTSPPSMAATKEATQAAPLVQCQNVSGGLYEFLLNRPTKMNALNFEMIRAISNQLKAWEESDKVKIVTVKSDPGVAFCAGGDVKAVVDYSKEGQPEKAFQFFKEEYQLDHMISALDTPYIAIMDGVTMGGGVGLSAHAAFRIATENTLFAMPETKIGFFPDVGGSFFLPRLDGHLGVYLGLTGKRLKATDTLYAGVATHYVPSDRLAALESHLASLENPDHDTVDRAIDAFAGDLDHAPAYSLGKGIRDAIDRCFRFDHMDDVMAAIKKEQEHPDLSAWAQETLKYLTSMSPTSLTVALEGLRRGRSQTIAQCFQMEFHLLQKFLVSHDMHEGVYKTLVYRGQTSQWQPPTLADIDRDTILQKYFEAPSPWPTLPMIATKDFTQYPYRHYTLPTEQDIKDVVVSQQWETPEQVVDHFVDLRHGKQGVKQKVAEILAGRTRQQGATLVWID